VGRRLTILSFGVRGDVQPLVALSKGLIGAGWEVTLAADPAFESWIRGHGVGFAPLRFDWRKFLNSGEGREAVVREKAPRDSFERLVRPMLDDCYRAAQGAEALVYDTMLVAGNHIAQKLGIPALMTSVCPNFSPTSAFPPPGTPRLGWGGWGNRLGYQLYRLAWWTGGGDVRRWCEGSLGFRPSAFHDYWSLRGRPIPIAYS
jgi:sterol 3beta-glucosyltransferase